MADRTLIPGNWRADGARPFLHRAVVFVTGQGDELATPFAGCTGEELHPRVKDMRGQRFGRLLVVAHAGRGRGRNHMWECLCDCGQRITVVGADLRCGDSQSCGCHQRDIARSAGDRTRTHGMSSAPIYKLWSSMLQRCYDESHADFQNYGARGISVCVRWWSFETFFEDMGHRPEGMSLNRIDNDGNYEPGNCRWATFKQQHRNKRTNRLLEFRGVTQCLTDWAAQLGMATSTLEKRLDKGWSVAMAFETPINRNLSRRKK